MKYNLSIGNNEFKVEIREIINQTAKVNVNGQTFEVKIGNFTQPPGGLGVSSCPQAVTASSTGGPPGPAKQPDIATEQASKAPAVDASAPIGAPQKIAPVSDSVSPAAAPEAVESSPQASAEPASGGATITAPIPGLILDVKVAVGDSVIAGQTVAVMEAMKMENNIVSNTSGTVQEIKVSKGTEVVSGQVIMVID